MPIKAIIAGAAALLGIMLILMTMGWNDNGYRTVVQTPTGHTYVKFEPGVYFQFGGTATEYPDFVTFDFDKNDSNDDGASINQRGIDVQYQEGGKGVVYGQVRFALPATQEAMIDLHKAYRSHVGIGNKLIRPSSEEIVMLTAKLMTSDESYMEKSAVFGDWVRDQLVGGKYKTKLQSKEVKDETAVDADKKVWKEVPTISLGKDGLAEYAPSDLKTFQVRLASFQIVGFDYEEKTVAQIQARREAAMEIITAKANAERAKQDAETAEAVGKKNVTVAKYEKEVEKERAVVDAQKDKAVALLSAERAKEVAETAAKQRVAVAEQEKLEKEQNKLAMAEYKQAETLRGEGDASYKKAVIEADGALAQKLEVYQNVMYRFADQFGRQKWVPEIVFGTSATPGGTGNQAADLINLLNAKTAKDLSLDLGISATRATAQK